MIVLALLQKCKYLNRRHGIFITRNFTLVQNNVFVIRGAVEKLRNHLKNIIFFIFYHVLYCRAR